jgi:26S proteasome regulatory subunit N13
LVNLKSANKKMFFWMQEPDNEKDEKLWKKLLDILNGVETSSSADRQSSSSLSSLANVLGGDLGGSDIQSLLGSMSEQQIQQLLGLSGFGGSQSSSRATSSRPSRVQSSRQAQAPATSTTTTTTTAAASATPITTTNQAQPMDTTTATTTTTSSGTSDASKKLQFSEFQNLLQNLSQNPQAEQAKIDLADMITLDVMAPILANKEIQERLMPHLAEGDVLPKNETELRNTFSAPQFKRAMHSFSDALQSCQLGPLLAQFNLPKQVIEAANNGNLEEFAKAMQSYSKSSKSSQEDDQKMDH